MRLQDRFRQRMSALLAGRYGSDHLNRFLCVVSLVLILSSTFTRAAAPALSSLLFMAGAALLVWCYIRMFSRSTEKRYAENVRYLSIRNRVSGWFSDKREQFRQRRDYAFFRCPGCRCTMRVPRGKGRLRITCRKCGYTFERKT